MTPVWIIDGASIPPALHCEIHRFGVPAAIVRAERG
jgi:hypothetical protein